MSDIISRQAAVDAFDGVKVDEDYCTEYDIGYNDGIDFAVSKLSLLPSAQQWIPCSERLPEEHYDDDLGMSYSDPVLATFGGNTERDPIKFWTVIVVFTKDGKWMHDIDRPVKTTKTIGITAWKPWPEPYEE